MFTSSSLHATAPSGVKFESKEEINEDLGPNNLYARSKLANLLYARYLAKEVANEPVYINAIHPGAVKTGIPSFPFVFPNKGYLHRQDFSLATRVILFFFP